MKPETWDLFIGVLWSRFGSATGAKNPATGEDYGSGTYEEFCEALKLFSNKGRPAIKVYRGTHDIPTKSLDAAQYGNIQKFFTEFDHDGKHPGLVKPYDGPEKFNDLILPHLLEFITLQIDSAQPRGKPGKAGTQFKKVLAKARAENKRLTDRNEKLHAVLTELSTVLSQQAPSKDPQEQTARLAKVYAELETKHQLPAGTLASQMPVFAEKLIQAPETSLLDRARALFAEKKYARAESVALEAKAHALNPACVSVQDAVAALELAGHAASQQIHYAQALDHFRAAAVFTDEKRDALEWARMQHMIAYVLDDEGKSQEAERILQRVVQVHQSVLGAEHPNTLMSRNNLAIALDAQGKYAEAEKDHRAVLAIRERMQGAEHPDTLASRSNLADALHAQGKYAEAEKQHRARIVIEERVLGAEHPDTLMSRNNLANALAAQGKDAEAEKEHRAVLAIRERVLGAEHPDTLSSRNNLANVLATHGKYGEAEKEHRAVLVIRERMLGAEHRATLNSRSNLANALQCQGKDAEAEKEHREVLAIRERVLGAEHPDVFHTCYLLARCLEGQKKFPEALVFIQRAESGWQKTLGADHPLTKDAKAIRERIERTMKAGK